MQYIKKNLPETADEVEVRQRLKVANATDILETHIIMGCQITGGVLRFKLPEYKLSVIMDIDDDTFTVTADPDHPNRIES